MFSKIVLSFPTKCFTDDFLNMEVNKRLAVSGDKLFECLKQDEKQNVHKRSSLFSSERMYCCGESKGNVILVGTRI